MALSRADLVVGTSAGSLVALRLAAGRSMTAQFRLLAGPRSPVRRMLMLLYARAAPPGAADLAQAISRGPRSTEATRRERGGEALAARTMPAAALLAFTAVVVRVARWPRARTACVAVDAVTGRLAPLTAADRVSPVRAAAASSAVPTVYPPVRVNGVPHIDGGTRSATNADLAHKYGTVLIIVDHAFVEGDGPLSRAQLDRELAVLRAAGCRVILVEPDAASRATLAGAMDPATIVPAAREGLRQGREVEAARIRRGWVG